MPDFGLFEIGCPHLRLIEPTLLGKLEQPSRCVDQMVAVLIGEQAAPAAAAGLVAVGSS